MGKNRKANLSYLTIIKNVIPLGRTQNTAPKSERAPSHEFHIFFYKFDLTTRIHLVISYFLAFCYFFPDRNKLLFFSGFIFVHPGLKRYRENWCFRPKNDR